MKKLLSLLALLLFIALPVNAEDKKSVPAPQTDSSISIGVIDVVRLVSQSDAGKSISSQLEARAKSLQAEAASIEKSLMAEEQTLVAEQAKTKPADFEPKRKAFEAKINSTRESLLKKNQALENARAKALSELQKHIANISANIADQKKLRIIIDRASVVIVEQNLDVTAEALSQLNAKVKSIKVGG
jgi:outer membrane protein